MVKVIELVRRKPGLSREEFSEHYEKVHAPLTLKYFSTIKRYVRNHVIPTPGIQEPEFDCVTEVWYDDMEGYQAGIDFWQSEAGQVIRDDEEKFVDGNKLVFFLVEENVSE